MVRKVKIMNARLTVTRKITTTHILYCCFVIGNIISNLSCKESIAPPPPNIMTPQWNIVPALASLDVRYMTQQNGTLYLAAVDPDVQETETINGRTHYKGDRGVVYSTTDAVTWTKIKGFNLDIGPMTYHDDTLYCLVTDSIHRLLPNGEWQTVFKTPDRLADASADGDMVFYKDTLYAMQTFFGNAAETYRIHPDGSFEELLNSVTGILHFSGAKFIKIICNGKEYVYLRAHWNAGGLFSFDGNKFTDIKNGISPEEYIFLSSNAMAIKNDTLVAGFGGFGTPASIKVLIGNSWKTYKDTLPNSHSAFLLTPILRTLPTAITFAYERMFVATNSLGVLEWKNDKGWRQMSEGLIPGFIPGLNEKDLYHPLPFLEYFKGKLIAAYGQPGYGPWGGIGTYTYTLK